jgi:hypothetical protein
MFNRLLFIGVLIIIQAISASAQIHKRFLNKNGKIIKDSTKADSYILYQKEGPDSLWSMVKLDMQHLPMEKGTYLDEELTIPHGKFVYYRTNIIQKKVDAHHSLIDTVFTVRLSGYYSNGLKEGIWMTRYPDGNKRGYLTYEQDVLNGLCETYDDNGKLYSRGNYIKGLREGDWYAFKTDSSITEHQVYVHGWGSFDEQFDEKHQMYSAYPPYNFEYSIKKYLIKTGLPPSHGDVLVAFTVTIDGKLINPEIKMGVNPELDDAILKALNNCPNWAPAKLNNKKIEQKLVLAFNYDISK